jgi:demethylmenaquinone methyltransferase/2-methoxy-6-polyprenyl-1,4-benzoquinol methylase
MTGRTVAVNDRARELFAPLGPTYDRYARLLSLGQDPRWRRFLVSRMPVGSDDVVLDVATGTGAVACELVRSKGCSVVGVDQSPEMLAVARRRLTLVAETRRIRFVEARAEELPFEDASFDGLTFTYLLRYVEDVGATLSELARVVRPGGTIAALEFAVPPQPLWRTLWGVYVTLGLPALGRLIAAEWSDVGRFLGPSIRTFDARYPPSRLLALWCEAGIDEVRCRRLSLGGAIVTWGRRA